MNTLIISDTLLLNTGMISLLRTLTEPRTLSVNMPGSKRSMSTVTTSQRRPHRW